MTLGLKAGLSKLMKKHSTTKDMTSGDSTNNIASLKKMLKPSMTQDSLTVIVP